MSRLPNARTRLRPALSATHEMHSDRPTSPRSVRVRKRPASRCEKPSASRCKTRSGATAPNLRRVRALCQLCGCSERELGSDVPDHAYEPAGNEQRHVPRRVRTGQSRPTELLPQQSADEGDHGRVEEPAGVVCGGSAERQSQGGSGREKNSGGTKQRSRNGRRAQLDARNGEGCTGPPGLSADASTLLKRRKSGVVAGMGKRPMKGGFVRPGSPVGVFNRRPSRSVEVRTSGRGRDLLFPCL